jgi:hypothetical protein
MAFSSCLFLTAVATATVPAIPTSHVLFRRIQREGSMLKGLSTAGHFMPAARPSQAAAVTWWCAPKAAHCLKLSLLLPSLCWRTRPCCADITASIVLVSLPSMRWHRCPSFSCFCPIVMPLVTRCCCRAGFFANTALASLPALHWHLCRRCAGIVASCHAGITASIALESSLYALVLLTLL